MQTYPTPSLCVYDQRAPARFRLAYNWSVAPTDSRHKILDHVVAVSRKKTVDPAVGTPWRRIVLHAHGLPGFIQLGEGIGDCDVQNFSKWRGLSQVIVFQACLLGSTRQTWEANARPGLQALGLNETQIRTAMDALRSAIASSRGQGDGVWFAREVARATGSYVVLSEHIQLYAAWLLDKSKNVTQGYPLNAMSDMEGSIVIFDPSGSLYSRGALPDNLQD